MNKKQSVVAPSTTEAEYMAATHASKEAVWLQRLCSSMGLVHQAIRIDVIAKVKFSWQRNLLIFQRQSVQYHFVRDMVEDKKALLVR